MIDSHLEHICRDKHLLPIQINMHTHKHDELVYFIKGNGSTQILNSSYNYKAGSFAFYRAGTQHNEINPEPCDIIWLHFTYNINNINLQEGLYNDSQGELLSLLQKLKRISTEDHKFRQSLTEIYLSEAIVTAAKLQLPTSSTVQKIEWQKILDYIDENSTNQIDFAKLALCHGYSYDRFRHMFKEHFGISLYSYVLNQRIQHAHHLLKNSSCTLTDIAYNCGFSSSSQFSNIFKKYTTLTPGEYRKNLNANKNPTR